jgi:hypothetical protein
MYNKVYTFPKTLSLSYSVMFRIRYENMINIFERKILRKIFGAVREGYHWREWYNNELYGLYTEQDLVLCIKVGRM